MRILLAITLCAFAVGAGAQVYRWTDAQGRTHVTDTPPPASAKTVTKSGAATAATSAATPQPTAQEPFAVQQAKAKFPVTLYTVASCEGCDAARKLLNARGVPFKEVSLTGAAPAQMEEFKEVVGGNTAPAMVVGSTVQKGFEESAYQRLLDAAGYPATGIVPPRTQAAPAASAAALPEVKPVAQPDQPAGPYSPGATAPLPPIKKKK
jgi:glutaredoxin